MKRVFRAEKFYADEEIPSWLKEKSRGWTEECDGKTVEWCNDHGFGSHVSWLEEVEE